VPPLNNFQRNCIAIAVSHPLSFSAADAATIVSLLMSYALMLVALLKTVVVMPLVLVRGLVILAL